MMTREVECVLPHEASLRFIPHFDREKADAKYWRRTPIACSVAQALE